MNHCCHSLPAWCQAESLHLNLTEFPVEDRQFLGKRNSGLFTFLSLAPRAVLALSRISTRDLVVLFKISLSRDEDVFPVQWSLSLWLFQISSAQVWMTIFFLLWEQGWDSSCKWKFQSSWHPPVGRRIEAHEMRPLSEVTWAVSSTGGREMLGCCSCLQNAQSGLQGCSFQESNWQGFLCVWCSYLESPASYK